MTAQSMRTLYARHWIFICNFFKKYIVMTIKERLSALRAAMQQVGISAYIVPSTDPHASEYVPDRWKDRPWISGFTGSAGVVVVTSDEAGLWTDSRYFLQAEQQLAGSGIDLYRDGIPGTPSINQWLRAKLRKGDAVAVNAMVYSVAEYRGLEAELAVSGIELRDADLISPLWLDRPAIPANQCFVLDEKYAGEGVQSKIERVRARVRENNADTLIISSLDEIAWLLNLRGSDVEFNPVFISYVLLTQADCTLFIVPDKISKDVDRHLLLCGVKTAGYDTIGAAIAALPENSRVLVDDKKLNNRLFSALPIGVHAVCAPSPIQWLKSQKNAVEIEGFRRAMVTDGVALVRFFRWLEGAVAQQPLTECDVMDRLREFRSKGENFVGESFGTIAGYKDHGAIVHYEAEPESCHSLRPDGILLLDSGGQYLDGTTDITRTITLGNPSDEQKRDYTLVLKGHIALARVQFPEGTRGNQLDILARHALWQNGLHYGHGTGHGVGHFLCVHEGPQSIRTDNNTTELRPGMVMSDEPGLYRTGKWGIRIENLVTVVEGPTTEFAHFYRFETLTLCPYDKRLIDFNLLDSEEIEWVRQYHAKVYDAIAPHLNDDEKTWLKEKCQL